MWMLSTCDVWLDIGMIQYVRPIGHQANTGLLYLLFLISRWLCFSSVHNGGADDAGKKDKNDKERNNECPKINGTWSLVDFVNEKDN